MSLTLFFKEGKDKRLYFQFMTNIKFIEYENERKTISLLKNVTFRCDLDGNFIIDPCKVFYKKQDEEVLRKTICVNCNKVTSLKRLNKIPFYFLSKFVKYLRCLSTQDQLKSEENDILNAVYPIIVLEHKEKGADSKGNKQHFTDLKIGLIRTEKSDLPIPIKSNYPKLQNKDSKRLDDNPMIKNGQVEVCENCYFMLNNVYNMTNSDLNAKILQNEYKKNVKRENEGCMFEKKDINNEEKELISKENKILNKKDIILNSAAKNRKLSSSHIKILNTDQSNSLLNADIKETNCKSDKSSCKLYSHNSIFLGSTAQSTPYILPKKSNDYMKNMFLTLEEPTSSYCRPFTTRNNLNKYPCVTNQNYSNLTNSLGSRSSFSSSKIYSATTTIKTPKFRPDNKPIFNKVKVKTIRTSLKKN